MAKTGKTYSKKDLAEALTEMVETMVLEEKGAPVQPSGDMEKLKQQIKEASDAIREDDEFSEKTADIIEWVLDNLEVEVREIEEVVGDVEEVVEKTSPKFPKEKKEVQKKPRSSERLAFLAPLIAENKWTRKDLVEKAMTQFPNVSKDAIQTILSDGKNPKYNRFDALIVEQENGVMGFKGKN